VRTLVLAVLMVAVPLTAAIDNLTEGDTILAAVWLVVLGFWLAELAFEIAKRRGRWRR
jgi:hypothetical protein